MSSDIDGSVTVTVTSTLDHLLDAAGLAHRERQDEAYQLASAAVRREQRVVIQAPTGVGKSLVALAVALDVGRPGAPGIIAVTMNNLSDQYLRDCARLSKACGFTYTRVMGRSHYACADSVTAQRTGVPSIDALDEVTDLGDRDDLIEDLRRARNGWLNDLRSGSGTLGRPDPATWYETRSLGLDSSYACPGYPVCSGSQIGGCGAKLARSRSWSADVVITNFHVLTYQQLLDPASENIKLVPLRAASVVIIDEAHELPGVIIDITSGTLTETSGSRVYTKYQRVKEAVHAWLSASLDACHFGPSRWDDTVRVEPDSVTGAAFVEAYQALTDEERSDLAMRELESLTDGGRDELDEESPGRVVEKLRAFYESSYVLPPQSWRAWARATWERDRFTGAYTWKPERVGVRSAGIGLVDSRPRVIHLTCLDAAARLVPAMLPPAAVLMSATVSPSLPAQLGLGDAVVHHLGQVFDWSRVTGYVSAYSGVKSQPDEVREARLTELVSRVSRHHGVLVLTNSFSDVNWLAERLSSELPGYEVIQQERGGGSLVAERDKQRYVELRQARRDAILIGTNSYATGLDLPGDLCTCVVLWTCVPQQASYVDDELNNWFGRQGHRYHQDKFHTRVTQSIGRLLRGVDDTGEVIVCDSRLRQYLRALSPLDQHLDAINWVSD